MKRTRRGSREAVPFLLDDGTGSVLVDPTDASLRLAEVWVADPATRPSERPGSTLRDAADDLLGARTYDRSYYESRLDEGETVTVRGRIDADESLAALGSASGSSMVGRSSGTPPPVP